MLRRAAPQPGRHACCSGCRRRCRDCAVVLRLDSRVDGVGVDPRQPPLCWEAWTADGWTECEVAEDATGGLNRPGEVVLHVPAGHLVSRVGRIEAGWLRCRVIEPQPGQPFYSASPTVRSASAFTIGGTTRVAHAEMVRDEPLGESTGVPGQRLRLAHAPVVGGPSAAEAGDLRRGRLAGLAGRPRLRRLGPARPAPHPRRGHRRDRLRPLGARARRRACASTGPCRPRARPSGPRATAPAAGGPATWRAARSRCCAAPSRTSRGWRTGRRRAAGSTARRWRRPRCGRRSRCAPRNGP